MPQETKCQIYALIPFCVNVRPAHAFYTLQITADVMITDTENQCASRLRKESLLFLTDVFYMGSEKARTKIYLRTYGPFSWDTVYLKYRISCSVACAILSAKWFFIWNLRHPIVF